MGTSRIWSLPTIALCLSLSGLSLGQIVTPSTTVRHKGEKRGLAHTNYEAYVGNRPLLSMDAPFPPMAFGPAQGNIIGYHPTDIRDAYSLPQTGGSQAIAIIDAYDLPTSLNDFNVFAREFNLPTETSSNATSSSNKVLQVIYASGSKPTANGEWGGEIALDIEWAHAIAPSAKIYLIECKSDNLEDLFTGVQYVTSNLKDVREVNMSFGADEFQGENTSYDSMFTTANLTYFASAGDESGVVSYPAASPNVIGVGGTTLEIQSGSVVSEMGWNSGGGGPSAFESRPSYQNSAVGVVGSARGTPDLAADADPNTGCAVYDSTEVSSQIGKGWLEFGGTSLACPICSAIANLRASFSATSFDELVRDYSLEGTVLFRDITSGRSGQYSCLSGFDFVTGIGVPVGLFNIKNVAPTSIAISNGFPLSGVPDEVDVQDGHDFILRSLPGGGFAENVTISGTFATAVAPGNALSARLTIVGETLNATNSLLLYDVKAAKWDSFSFSGTSAANTALVVDNFNFATYADANGNVKFQIVSTSAGAGFNVGFDLIQVSVDSL